jgi:hypothetical protein
MVHRYVQYNSHGLTIQVNFMVNVCVRGGGFRSNGFVIKTQPFAMHGHYRTDVISSVGHPMSDLVVLRTVAVQWLRHRHYTTGGQRQPC